MGNRVIYSDVAVSLQAVVLPAEALMYLNKLTRDESLYCFPCVTSRLSPLVSRIQISITPPFSSLSHLLAAIISRSVSSLCYVSFSPPRSQCVAATVRPRQDQVVLKSWQRQRRLALPGRYPARGCEVWDGGRSNKSQDDVHDNASHCTFNYDQKRCIKQRRGEK